MTADGWTITTQKLANKSVEYLKNEFDSNNLSRHKDSIVVKSLGNRYKNGFSISVEGDPIVMFNEFGTGIVGEGTNPLADAYGYKYNVGPKIGIVPEMAILDYAKRKGISEDAAGEILKGMTTKNTWWYFKNGSWRHTEGMKAKNIFSDLELELAANGYKAYNIKYPNGLRR